MTPRGRVARGRLRLHDRLRRALLGRTVGRAPASVLRSVAEKLYLPQVARHVQGVTPGDDASVQHYDFPAAFPPFFRRAKAFDPRPLLRLGDVCVGPESGLVWLPGGDLIQESVGSLNQLLGRNQVLTEALLPAPAPDTALNTGSALIVHPRQSFFHWLLETLPPTLRLLERDPQARLLLAPRPPRYVQDAFGFLLGPDWQERVVWSAAPLRVPSLWLLPREEFSGFVRRADLELLRSRFQAVWETAPPGPARLYISRTRSPNRAVANEAALEAALVAQGFTAMHAEDLSLLQQIALLAHAREVVALHGAGLSNLLWCRPGTRVTEVFAPGVFNDCYARLSLDLGLEYSYVQADAVSGGVCEVPVGEVVAAVMRR